MFHGREDLIELALARFDTVSGGGGRRMLVVIGASGAGKSSLIHAGVVPLLVERGWSPVEVDLNDAPAAALGPADPARQDLVVIDHVERLFTGAVDADTRAEVLQALDRLTDPGAASAVVLGLRGDFFERATGQTVIQQGLQRGQVVVGPMTADQLRAVIVEPAREAGVDVDEALVALLLHECGAGGSGAGIDIGALPLLSHALRETWLAGTPGRMTVADYELTGGIARAIEQSADLAYKELTPEGQDLTRQVFLRLVHVDGSSPVTRRRAPLQELVGLVEVGTDELDAVLDTFVSRRLLTVNDSTVEIAHEALLSAWGRYRTWVSEADQALRTHRRVRESAATWDGAGRRASDLVRGAALTEMRELLVGRSNSLALSRVEREFLDASTQAEQAAAAQQRIQVVRLRSLLAVATILAVVGASLAVVAFRAGASAKRARDEATSRQLAAVAQALAGRDASLASQIAIAAYRTRPTLEARSTLLDLGADAVPTRLTGHAGSTAVTISASGSLLALSDSTDGSVSLFVPGPAGYARSGRIELGAREIYALAMTPDERVLAVGDTEAEISLWDVTDPAAPSRLGAPLSGPTGPIQKIAISPDGNQLAAVGAGAGVYRWSLRDVGAPRRMPTVPVPSEVTWNATYSEDGRYLAVGDDDGRVAVYTNAPRPRLLSRVQVGLGHAGALDISPNGRYLVAGTATGEFRVRDIADPARPDEITDAATKFSSWVNAVGFSHDGRYVVGGSSDTTLRVWRTDTWAKVTTLPHPGAITQVSFADDGTLVTAAVDGSARVWPAGPSFPRTFDGRVFSVGFTPDGRRFAVISGEDVHVWDVDPHPSPAWRPGAPVASLPGDPSRQAPVRWPRVDSFSRAGR